MKKNFYWLFIMACVSLISFTSCDPKDPVDDPDETTKMRIKTMTFEYDWGSGPGSTSYAYTYDAQGRVIKVVETGEDWTDEFNLDWSQPGKVNLIRQETEKNRTWILNAAGYVSKIENIWGDGGDVTFEYDANGLMSKAYEDYGTPELKSTFTALNGNITAFTRGDRVKNFTFSSGDNIGNIYQVFNDSFVNDWQAHTGLFGKACKNLNTKVQWSDKEDFSAISFEFYEDGRVKKVIRSGSDWYENYVYTYETVE
ncbi:hypothetical protein SDC9_78976 [bioreactor metagenome]|jgi:hypothetical protein|uniref:Uncharacterized protein n=1 Tax=bioreactor metagenome TaxID=1076179 RepID=A0A644Z2N4_9ZZZZ|nr:hypothetical protein [Paludibacter sp.]